MPDTRLVWILAAPLLSGLIAILFLLAQNRKIAPPKAIPWLRFIALLSALAGLAAQAVLLVLVEGSITLDALGITLSVATPARFVLLAADVSLVCAAISAWTGEDEAYQPGPEWALIMSTITASLLAGAALVDDSMVAAFALLGAALLSAALALARPRAIIKQEADEENLRTQMLLARRITGGLKQLALATLGTGLLAVGVVLVARYTFNLENRGLLQLGLALLAVGIIVRAAGMPFAAASADTIEAAPSSALMMLGAAGPVTLVAGLLILAPLEGSLASGATAGWLGAIGAFLAGLRALGVALEEREGRKSGGALEDREQNPTAGEANLIAMTVAAATGWAIFGILSASHMGAIGAVLIATNMALALPIVIMGRRLMVIGTVSLLGLPPLGGFAGMILVAQSAANASGLWLALLLIGSTLVAAGWLMHSSPQQNKPDRPGWRARATSPAYLIPTLLLIVQLALFLAAPTLIDNLTRWAATPWLTAP